METPPRASAVRGQFLTYMVQIETEINVMLRDYVEVPLPKRDFFDHYVIDKLDFKHKARMLRRIVKDQAIKGYDDVLKELDGLYQIRNSMAHDRLQEPSMIFGIGIDDEDEDGGPTITPAGSTPVGYFIRRDGKNVEVPFDTALWERLRVVAQRLWDLRAHLAVGRPVP